MENEHISNKDSTIKFATSNGVEGVTSAEEWEFVYTAKKKQGEHPGCLALVA